MNLLGGLRINSTGACDPLSGENVLICGSGLDQWVDSVGSSRGSNIVRKDTSRVLGWEWENHREGVS